MKTKLLIAAGLVGVSCLMSCEKAEDTLPKLEAVDDVCTKMDDINFMKYCYDNFDVNKDGKVSMPEANAVKEISDFNNPSLLKVVSYTGIEYFSSLEKIQLGAYNTKTEVRTMDLRYNNRLTSISLNSATHISSLDLRSNVELKSISMHYCTRLTSIYLPKSIESIQASAFNGCDCLTIVDMSQCVDLKEILVEEHTLNSIYTFSSEVIDEFLIGATVPPKTSITANRPIKSKSIKTLKVPAESVEAYENSVWEDYAVKIIPLEN